MVRTFTLSLSLLLVLLSGVACNAAPDNAPQVLEDGWVRYTLPDTNVIVELPERFTAFVLTSNTLTESQNQLQEQFAAAESGYNLQSLYESGVRLAAFDQAQSQTIFPIANMIAATAPATAGNTVTASTQSQVNSITSVGGQIVAEPVQGQTAGVVSSRFSFSISTTLNTSTPQRIDQLLFVVGGNEVRLQVIYPLEQADTYSPIADEIFNRISLEG